jgi:hypothetical protein
MMKVYGFIDTHEAKLMVKDYKQKLNDLEIHHMNFKAVLLNGRRINLYKITIRIQSIGEGNEYVYAC